MNCYCALHERVLGEKGNVHFDDGKHFLGAAVTMPGNRNCFIYQIDPRDQRVLVVFDGFWVTGGLPKNNLVLDRRHHGGLSIKKENFEEPEDYTVQPNYMYNDNCCKNCSDGVAIPLKRWFILLPSCIAVVYRFRPKSLSPQGVIIKVENGVARFETTTY